MNLAKGKHMRFETELHFVVVANPLASLSVTAAIILKNTNMEGKQMSRVATKKEFEDPFLSKDRIFVLFYASWCPFSQRFLPTFERFSKDKSNECARIVVDDKPSLSKKYSIEVVPTVLFFEKGQLKKRLDGATGKGLSEETLLDFSKKC